MTTEETKDNPPEYGIKYYGNPQYIKEVLSDREIAFVSIRKLNDPFDPITNLPHSFKRKELLRHIQTVYKKEWQKRPAEIRPHINEIFKNKGRYVALREEELKKHLHVFSFCAANHSEYPDNLLMWSHYGAGHSGIAIKLEIKKESGLFKISYEDNIPEVNKDEVAQHILEISGRPLKDKVTQIASCKAKCWEYEDEWRIALDNSERKMNAKNGIIKVPIDNVLHSIYLGLRTPEEERQEYISLTRKNFPKAKIYQAKQKPNRFELEFTELP